MPSTTEEDYLKAILGHTTPRTPFALVRLGDIARDLSVTPGTVTPMMKQLARSGLVEYEPRRGVQLTDSGRRAALEVTRRHRLIERFLVDVMGIDWADVHEEAEVLEHVFSGRVLRRMDEMLGHPSHDPHGAPIPAVDGTTPERSTEDLLECTPGEYRLAGGPDSTPGLLDWLRERNLTPGTRFTLHEVDRLAEAMTITLEGAGGPVAIGFALARKLQVTPLESQP
jgi:DtxR family Mn-dependent transcriptional regulator